MFTADGAGPAGEQLQAVSFYTAENDVTFTVKIYDRFEGGELLDELSSKTGTIDYKGFHTVDLDAPLSLTQSDQFYVYVSLSGGGHAFDRTSEVPVLLGSKGAVWVPSSASAGESYFHDGMGWVDFYGNPDTTSNFCIKALSTAEAYLILSCPDGPPELVAPGEDTTFTVQITEATEGLLPGSATLHWRTDGGSFSTSTMIPFGGDIYEATLPAFGCADSPEFYITAESDGGHMVMLPYGAPATLFSAEVGVIVPMLQDDFEINHGWVSGNLGATAGYWQHGTPVNDPDWAYDPETDGDGSGQCWLTHNTFGNTDVDAGAVTLTSITYDMTGGGDISYYYFLYLTDTGDEVDRLLVELSSDDGDTWTEIAVHTDDHGLQWQHHTIPEADILTAGVTFTSTMKVRFTANDANPQSIVEAAVDGFMFSRVVCDDGCCGQYTGGITGNTNCDTGGTFNLSDITAEITRVYIDPEIPLCCEENGDVNCDGKLNLSDITILITRVYLDTEQVLCPCSEIP